MVVVRPLLLWLLEVQSDNKAHLPQQFDFPSVSLAKPKWSGGRFRLSHKDRTDSLGIPSRLNQFVKGNEHRKNIFGEFVSFSFSHVQIFSVHVCLNINILNFVRCINKVISIATPLTTPMA